MARLQSLCLALVPLLVLLSAAKPAAAQISLVSFQPFPINNLPFLPPGLGPLVDITFNSPAPIVQLILFFRAPDNFVYPYPITFNQGPTGPNSWHVQGPMFGPALTQVGLHRLTRINAVNALNQVFNIENPLNSVPDYTFTIVPQIPFSLTGYTQAPLVGANSLQSSLSFTFSSQVGLSLSGCSITFQGPSSTSVVVPIFQAAFDSVTHVVSAQGTLNLNDPARPSGPYVATSLSCANSNSQTLNVAAANFPGGAPPPLIDSHCSLPAPPVPSGSTDVTAPTLTCVILRPAPVDVTLNDANVNVIFAFTDNLSGADSFDVTLTSPTGIVYQPNSVSSINGQLSGIRTFGIPIRRYSAAGSYTLSITTRDLAGNSHVYSSQDLASLGFASTLPVTDTNADLTPPSITSFTFIPNHLDTSSQDVTVTLQVGILDAKSGFSSGSLTLPYDDGQLAFRELILLDSPGFFVSGDNHSGVFQTTITFEKHYPAGVYNAVDITLQDTVGNKIILPTLPSPAPLTITSTTPDLQRPKLVSFEFSPKSINTTGADQVITFTSAWSDDRSGFPGGPNITLRSPSGISNVYGTKDNCALISFGNAVNSYPRNVVYRCTAVVPRYSEPGTWTVSGLGIGDGITFGPGPFGRSLNTGEIAALGFPTRFFNIQSGDSPDGFIGPAGGSVTAAANPLLGVSAPASVFTVSTGITMLNGINTSNVPIPQGFSGPGTNLVTFDLAPPPIAPFAAPGATLTVPTSSTLPANTTFVLYRLDPNSGALTPAPSVFGGAVTGTVNPAGTQATFTGLSALSSFVGFRRNSEVIGDLDGNNLVNCADVGIVKASQGRRAGQLGYDARADINRDGAVDIRDLAPVTRALPPGTVCP